jgi:glycosyltransferase involved in cell wall biosynthesis
MRKRPDLSLVLACYNEETLFDDSVKRILNTLKLSKLRFELIFVDDKSVDGTPTLISKSVLKHPGWKAIYHRRNMGRGRSVSDGILAAKGKVAGYIDMDLEVSSIYIPETVKMILDDEVDMVIGKRIYRTTLSSIIREIVSVCYRYLASNMVGTGNLDTESGYKFFNRKKILPILAKTRNPHWFWDTEIMVFARRANLRIREVPVLFLRRFDKKSSVNLIPDAVDYLNNLWKLWRRFLN